MEIAIDFDGTVVAHEYPKIGHDVGAIPVLKRLVEHGHKLILFTMRSGLELHEAIKWFEENDIPLYGKQYNPSQQSWTCSNKAYAQLYIDDAALGCPLAQLEGVRPYANWLQIEIYLESKGILPKTFETIQT